MSISEWASLAEIAGMGAVVISLIFVGFEIRSNTRQVQAEALISGIKFARTITGMTSTAEDAELFIRGINDFDDLSLSEKAIFHSKMHEIAIDFSISTILVNKGLLVDMNYSRFSRLMASLLLSPGVIRYHEVSDPHIPPFLAELFKKLQQDHKGMMTMSEFYKFKTREE